MAVALRALFHFMAKSAHGRDRVAMSSSTDPCSAYGNTVTAEIVALCEETNDILRLRLHISESFAFSPGQWVDFHIPGLSRVGGFSICTPPSLLKQHGHLDIAVQRSRCPPAAWVHQVASPGMQVRIQVGGPMSLEAHHCEAPCLFIGGGIGVAPLLSMWSHWAEEWHKRSSAIGSESNDSKVCASMLYTVKSESRCPLLQQLLQPLTPSTPMDLCIHFTADHSPTTAAGLDPTTTDSYTTTTLSASMNSTTTSLPETLALSQTPTCTAHQKSASEILQSLPVGCSVQDGRISVTQLAQHLTRLGSGCHVFLCGPPAMSDWAYGVLTGQLGHEERLVHLEKWW